MLLLLQDSLVCTKSWHIFLHLFWHFSVPTVQQHRHWRSNPAKRPRGRNANQPKPDLSSAASTLELSWKTGTGVMELNFTKDTIKEEKKNKRKKKKIEEENKRFELSSVLKPMWAWAGSSAELFPGQGRNQTGSHFPWEHENDWCHLFYRHWLLSAQFWLVEMRATCHPFPPTWGWGRQILPFPHHRGWTSSRKAMVPTSNTDLWEVCAHQMWGRSTQRLGDTNSKMKLKT